MNNINNIIGENIKKYRLLNNMTQEDLSKKLGIAPNTLSNYENGNREPNSDVISKLADIFDISLGTTSLILASLDPVISQEAQTSNKAR